MSDKQDVIELDEIDLRDAAADDEAFLFEVYAASRAEEFASLGWDAGQLESFIRMQFEMRRRSYAMQSPNANTRIVEIDGIRAGVLTVDIRDDAIELVDIAIAPEFRRRGIAEKLIKRLMSRARRIELTVETGNAAAITLYNKLGFRLTEPGDVYNKMVWENE